MFYDINSEYFVNNNKQKSANGLPMLSKFTEDGIFCNMAKSKNVFFKPISKI